MRNLAFLPIVGALASCAISEFSVPVKGVLYDGAPLTGIATARVSGQGTFSVTLPTGAICNGEYNSMSMEKQFTVPVSCTDGRHGSVAVTRNPGGLSGMAVVTLSDGTAANLVFGDIKLEDVRFQPLPPPPAPPALPPKKR